MILKISGAGNCPVAYPVVAGQATMTIVPLYHH